MKITLQPLRDPSDLPDGLFVIEAEPVLFSTLPPFYGIVKLPENFRDALQDGFNVELLSADGELTGYTVSDITRWALFEVE